MKFKRKETDTEIKPQRLKGNGGLRGSPIGIRAHKEWNGLLFPYGMGCKESESCFDCQFTDCVWDEDWGSLKREEG